MRTLVVFESIYGTTHAIADAVADGLRPEHEVRVVGVSSATAELVEWAELVVVGGPTHVHGMTRATTRKGARERAEKPDSGLAIDPTAGQLGVREWLATIAAATTKRAAAFDTRLRGLAILTGQASSGIEHGLRRAGFRLVAEHESFLINPQGRLVDGELDRARRWALTLVGTPAPVR